jgi:hypothetical protein
MEFEVNDKVIVDFLGVIMECIIYDKTIDNNSKKIQYKVKNKNGLKLPFVGYNNSERFANILRKVYEE